MGFTLSHAVLRLATGAYILNSGVSKLQLDAEGAAALQDMTANAIPQAKQLPPETFGKAVAATEIGLGAALLAPFVPTKLAALGLSAFAGGLLAVYAKTPGATKADGIRPTSSGTVMAKDVWLGAIGLALLLDRRHRKHSGPGKPKKS
ncbi:DoxX family protein [Sinomonas mesophila]|uniref:DoxX family protein n=1 Tax=Sinomonas mesophila TaxID=1531955 RepID=UPI0009851B6E|nr:DoxX family protein [Sinomonas mesophila]